VGTFDRIFSGHEPSPPHPEASLDDLAFAASHGRLRIVELLLQRGVDIDSRSGDSNATPLMFASLGNYSDVVKALAHAGADIEARDTVGATALMRSASFGYSSVVRTLIECGADVNATDNSGMTPLMWSVMSYDTEIINTLLDAGADVNARDCRGEKSSEKALYGRPRRFQAGNFDFTFAMKKPNNAIRKLLLSAECPVADFRPR